MRTETPFRIVTGVLFALLGVAGLRFRLQAARSGEDLRQQRSLEGKPLFALRVVAGLLGSSTVIAYLVNPRSVARTSIPLPVAVRWAGAGVAAASIPLLWWVLSHLGRNLTDTVAIRRDHTLVTTGPYRWVRHPFYAATSLVLATLTLVLANWLPAVALLLYWLYLWRRTPLEEAKLIERFGDAYRAYAARTGRFIPRLLQ
jgi:protein-S-isoprenylcysteine O-methyltransferase Ste14